MMSKKAINKSRRENKNAKNLDKEIKEKEIDYEKLAEAIVKAQIKAKEIEEQEAEKQIKEQKEQLNKKIRYKEIDVNDNWFIKILISIRNFFVVLFRLLFFKKRDRMPNANIIFVKLIYKIIMVLMQWSLYIMTIALIVLPFYLTNTKGFELNVLVCIPCAIIAFILARVIRLSIFEIEHIKDNNYMLALFSAITSFIAMVLAIIALFLR